MKKLVSFVLAALLLFGLAACGQPAEGGKPSGSGGAEKKTVYVLVKVLGNQYWSVVEAAVNQAAKDFDCNVVVVGTSSEAEVEKQIGLLQNAVSAQADAILIAPLDRNALVNPIREQYESGIPMVLISMLIDGEDYDCALLTDNYVSGRMAAEEMLRLLREKGTDENKVGHIAYQIGSAGSQTINDRMDGFFDYWNENAPAAWTVLVDDFKVNDGDIGKATTFGQDFLTTYADTLIGMFGPNNGSTVGFVTALTETQSTDVVMVGFDFSAEIETMIRSGDYHVSSILQNQYAMGYEGVRIALDLANGGSVDQKIIDTGVYLVNRENVDSAEVKAILGK